MFLASFSPLFYLFWLQISQPFISSYSEHPSRLCLRWNEGEKKCFEGHKWILRKISVRKVWLSEFLSVIRGVSGKYIQQIPAESSPGWWGVLGSRWISCVIKLHNRHTVFSVAPGFNIVSHCLSVRRYKTQVFPQSVDRKHSEAVSALSSVYVSET